MEYGNLQVAATPHNISSYFFIFPIQHSKVNFQYIIYRITVHLFARNDVTQEYFYYCGIVSPTYVCLTLSLIVLVAAETDFIF